MVYVYALKDDGEIFYIGQTICIEDRMYNHRSSAKYCRTIKEKRINEILTNNRELSHEILEVCEIKQGLKREHFHIDIYTKAGANLLNKRVSSKPSLRYANVGFSHKQKNLLQSLANDMTSQEIAKQVGQSTRTIETQVQKIKKILGAKSIAGLIRIAYNHKLIK